MKFASNVLERRTSRARRSARDDGRSPSPSKSEILIAVFVSLCAAAIVTALGVALLGIQIRNSVLIPVVATAVVVVLGLLELGTGLDRPTSIEQFAPELGFRSDRRPFERGRNPGHARSEFPSWAIDERGLLRLDLFPSSDLGDDPQCGACGATGPAVVSGPECPACGSAVGALDYEFTILASSRLATGKEEI